MVAIFAAIALLGLSRLSIDTSLTRLFHGQSKEFAKFERLVAVSPGAEHDVLLVVRGKTIFTTHTLSALKTLHLDLRVIDAVRSVTSIFNVREGLTARAVPPLVVPQKLPETAANLQALRTRLLAHPLAGKRLLAEQDDETFLLFIISLDPSRDGSARREAAVDEIRQVTAEILGTRPLEWQIGGIPQARLELLDGIRYDFLVFNALGFALGIVICALLLRDLGLLILAGLCPLLGAVVSVGAMGLMGVKLSPLLTAIPLLVMAVTFTDAMHIVYALNTAIKNGVPVPAAVEHAVTEVGPACVLASLTTAVALFSLMLAGSPLVTTFGLWAGLANLASVAMLLVLLPSLAVILLRNRAAPEIDNANCREPEGQRGIQAACRATGAFVRDRYRAISGLAVAAMAASLILYSQLEPQYRLSDQLNEQSDFRRVNAVLDEAFLGAGQIAVLVTAPEVSVQHATLLAAVRAAHEVMSTVGDVGRPLSIFSLSADSHADSWPPDADFANWIESIPPRRTNGLWRPDLGAALVVVPVADLEASRVARIAAEIGAVLAPVRGQFPALQFTVSGLPVLLARETPKIVNEINVALLAALIAVFAMIGLAFRSTSFALLSIVPNVLPITAAGGLTYFFVGGLDYASVIGLTVAFGLAVDDTIHFFNRYRLLSASAASAEAALSRTVETAGPVLITTSAVLLCTLAITMAGTLPPTRIFGQTCAVMLVAALVADLLLLPALIRASWSMQRSPLSGPPDHS